MSNDPKRKPSLSLFAMKAPSAQEEYAGLLDGATTDEPLLNSELELLLVEQQSEIDEELRAYKNQELV